MHVCIDDTDNNNNNHQTFKQPSRPAGRGPQTRTTRCSSPRTVATAASPTRTTHGTRLLPRPTPTSLTARAVVPAAVRTHSHRCQSGSLTGLTPKRMLTHLSCTPHTPHTPHLELLTSAPARDRRQHPRRASTPAHSSRWRAHVRPAAGVQLLRWTRCTKVAQNKSRQHRHHSPSHARLRSSRNTQKFVRVGVLQYCNIAMLLIRSQQCAGDDQPVQPSWITWITWIMDNHYPLHYPRSAGGSHLQLSTLSIIHYPRYPRHYPRFAYPRRALGNWLTLQ